MRIILRFLGSRANQMLFKFIASILIIYLSLTVILFFTQRKLLYFPTTNSPSEQFLKTEGLQYWQIKDNDYYGFISLEPKSNSKGQPFPALKRSSDPADVPSAKERAAMRGLWLTAFRGTIIVFHGNANLAHNLYYNSRALTARGYRVLLAEYPGYGKRKGKPSEEALISSARKIVKSIHTEYGEPIYLWGESLGSGVVAATVADSSLPVAGIVLITPWDTLSNLARYIYWYFPVRWILLDKFDNLENLKYFKGKVAILIAEKDEVVPPHFGLNLYQSIENDKKLWTFKNAGHNNFPIDSNEAWWQEVLDFIAE